jgi:hypothetical protein
MRSLFGVERRNEITLPGRNPLEGKYVVGNQLLHMNRLGEVTNETGPTDYAIIAFHSRKFYEVVSAPPPRADFCLFLASGIAASGFATGALKMLLWK